MTTPIIPTAADAAAYKAVRFRNPKRAFAFCYQLFKNDQRFAKQPELAKRLARQVAAGNYVFILEQKEVVGFASWLTSTTEQAEKWIKGEQDFAQENLPAADAIVVEQWRVTKPGAVKFLSQSVLDRVKDAGKLYAVGKDAKGATIPVRLERPATARAA
jgi:hypothetical protein